MKDIYLIIIGLVAAIPITFIIMTQPKEPVRYQLLTGEIMSEKEIKAEVRRGNKSIKVLQKGIKKHSNVKEIVEQNKRFIAEWEECLKIYNAVLLDIKKKRGGKNDD